MGQSVNEFCNWMINTYRAGFVQNQTMNGYVVMGEFFTRSGYLLTLQISVSGSIADIVISDNRKRRQIFSDKVVGSLTTNMRAVGFIQRTVASH